MSSVASSGRGVCIIGTTTVKIGIRSFVGAEGELHRPHQYPVAAVEDLGHLAGDRVLEPVDLRVGRHGVDGREGDDPIGHGLELEVVRQLERRAKDRTVGAVGSHSVVLIATPRLVRVIGLPLGLRPFPLLDDLAYGQPG
jgi:hypothetical protein